MNAHRVYPVPRELHSDEEPSHRCRACFEEHRFPDEFDGECPQAQLGLGEAS